MEDVVIPFTRRTSPNVSQSIAKSLDIIEVTHKDFMVHSCPEMARLEEVHRVQVGNVHPPEKDKGKYEN